ncbi:hypothetical protein GCM10017783_13060 [Deinococcus piscis]|uniref:Heat induced stress protein YflT n=1 Tax=Deinococcus piscis TaxID=394230 RepID=A0ABQ3K3D0_9DEIO|nr:hypothetical protein [Deinococcus piscis]GHG02183.1 hypothetical protein GCM10017783_13060 [Deinococcus piscis]
MESVVALFQTPQQAARALQVLESRGFDRDRLAFACTNVISQSEVASVTGISPEEGAPAGAGGVIKGAIMGALGGLALTVPVWILLALIPATRVYVDGGMYGALFGVLGGLTLGGLFGAISGSDHGDYVRLLQGFGMPTAHAERVYDRMKDGDVLVIARDADLSRTAEASNVLRQLGAVSLESVDTAGQPARDEIPLKSEGRQDRAAQQASEGLGAVDSTPAESAAAEAEQVAAGRSNR